MNRKRLFLTLLFAICLLLPGIVPAADAAQQTEPSLLPLKIGLAAGLALSIYGLYASRKKKIVVFANLTDIVATVAIPLVAFVFFFLARFFEMSGNMAMFTVTLPAFVTLVIVLKATYSYNVSKNAGLPGFLLALFTKLFLLAIYVCLVLLIFFGDSRRKGESESAFRNRARREGRARLLGTTAVFGFLAYLGLWDKNFVSLRQYMNGAWGTDDPA